MIFTDERARPEDSVNIKFGGNDRNNDKNYNLVWNNIHLISNDRVAAGDSDAFESAGPVLGSLINTPGRLVLPTGIWTSSSDTVSGGFQGFVGKFGIIRPSDGSKDRRTRGLFGYSIATEAQAPPSGFSIVVAKAADELTSFWRVAGSGDLPTLPAFKVDPPDTLTPGVVEPNVEVFSDLNVDISLYNKGIDVLEGTSISQDLRL